MPSRQSENYCILNAEAKAILPYAIRAKAGEFSINN